MSDKTFNVVNGPMNSDLYASLFYGEKNSPDYRMKIGLVVEFENGSIRSFDAVVTKVERTDFAKFNVWMSVEKLTEHRLTIISGNYSTETRTGTFRAEGYED